jgi:hypothetical protein
MAAASILDNSMDRCRSISAAWLLKSRQSRHAHDARTAAITRVIANGKRYALRMEITTEIPQLIGKAKEVPKICRNVIG